MNTREDRAVTTPDDTPRKPNHLPIPPPGRSAFHVITRWGPLLLLAVTLRLLSFSLLIRSGVPRDIDELLAQNAPPVLALLALAGLGWAWMRHRWPSHPGGVPLALAILAFAGTVFGVHAVAPWWLGEWLSPAAFAFVRWDALALIIAALASFQLLQGRRRWGWRTLSAFVSLAAALMTALFLFEFLYLVNVGAPGGWPVLRYALIHLPELLPLAAHTLHGGHLSLGALVVALALALLAIERVQFAPRAGAARQGRSQPAPRALWLAALPLLLVLVLTPGAPLAMDQKHGLLAALIQEGLTGPAPPPDAMVAMHPAQIGALDHRALRFTATAGTQTRNLVVIVLESARSRSATPYNPALTTMPFLATLAERGALVENLFTVVPHTNKSLVALLAGTFPSPSREMPEAEPGRLPGPGLPALLHPLGYASAFFTPATLQYEHKGALLRHLGFDLVVGDGDLPTEGFSRKAYFGYEDRIALEPSIRWVDRQIADGKPFFLTFLTLSAHHPYDVPGGTFLQRRDKSGAPQLEDYHDALRYTDAFLRDLFQEFERRGLMEKTVFVVVGDHGEAFGEHGQYTHGDVPWDEALQVPGILVAPGLIPAGTRIHGPRQHIDLLPTVAELLGLRIDGAVPPGRSLLQPAGPARELFHSAWNGRLALAVRRWPYKFIYYWGRRPTQAFDLRTDPGELRNIASQLPPEQIRAAETAMQEWFYRAENSYAEREPRH